MEVQRGITQAKGNARIILVRIWSFMRQMIGWLFYVGSLFQALRWIVFHSGRFSIILSLSHDAFKWLTWGISQEVLFAALQIPTCSPKRWDEVSLKTLMDIQHFVMEPYLILILITNVMIVEKNYCRMKCKEKMDGNLKVRIGPVW